jgi:hypothetical protein
VAASGNPHPSFLTASDSWRLQSKQSGLCAIRATESSCGMTLHASAQRRDPVTDFAVNERWRLSGVRNLVRRFNWVGDRSERLAKPDWNKRNLSNWRFYKRRLYPDGAAPQRAPNFRYQTAKLDRAKAPTKARGKFAQRRRSQECLWKYGGWRRGGAALQSVVHGRRRDGAAVEVEAESL